jgi:iron complex outermembrane receptor protein
VNASVFHYDYQGFQTLYDVNIFNPRSFVNVTVPATNIGGELETLYRPTQHDRIGLDVSYVQSSWYNKPAGFQAAYPLKNRALTPYTIDGNYTHVFNLSGGSTLSTRIDGQYQAAHQAQDVQAQYLNIGYQQYEYREAELIGNLSAVWSMSHYSLSVYVRNFTDAHYKQYTVGTNLSQVALDFTDPRTFGAQLSVHF